MKLNQRQVNELSIINNLKKLDSDIRLTCGGKWMYFDGEKWVVRTQEYRKRSTTILVETGDVETAISVPTN